MNSKKGKLVIVSSTIFVIIFVFFFLILILASHSQKSKRINKISRNKTPTEAHGNIHKDTLLTQNSCLGKKQINEIYEYFYSVFHKYRGSRIPFVQCSPYPPINEMLSLSNKNFCKTLLNFNSPFMTDFVNNSISDWVFTLQKIINECIPSQDTEDKIKFKKLLNEINGSVKLKIVIVNATGSETNVDGVPITPSDSIIKLNNFFWLPDNDAITINNEKYFICDLLKERVFQTPKLKITCRREGNAIRIILNPQE